MARLMHPIREPTLALKTGTPKDEPAGTALQPPKMAGPRIAKAQGKPCHRLTGGNERSDERHRRKSKTHRLRTKAATRCAGAQRERPAVVRAAVRVLRCKQYGEQGVHGDGQHA